MNLHNPAEAGGWVTCNYRLWFRKLDFAKIPSNAFGVYGIWFRGRCIYVGKAEDQPIAKRLDQHWRGTHNPQLADWISAKGTQLLVAYVIAGKRELDDLEQQHIEQYQPLTNKTHS